MTPRSYLMIGAPAGATISPSGAFTWTPGEEQNGMHAFVVNASAAGNFSTSHARTFRIAVAEDNAVPVIEPVPDMRAFTLSEIRFNIVATDEDLPAQTLAYCLGSDKVTFAAVLPNGTFVWTPSKYDMGTTVFNVSVADGFECNDNEREPAALVIFSVTVVRSRPPCTRWRPTGRLPRRFPCTGQVRPSASPQSFPSRLWSKPARSGAPYLELRTGATGAPSPL